MSGPGHGLFRGFNVKPGWFKPGGGGGGGLGYSWEFLVEACCLVLQILTLFQTKKFNFQHPFSDQTWPLGKNYVIITYIRAQTKKFLKSISNSHISLSFSLIWNWNDNYVHTLPLVPSKTIPNSPKWCKNLADGVVHTYIAYVREYPSPPGFKYPTSSFFYKR